MHLPTEVIRNLIVDRLGAEFGDAQLGSAVADRLDRRVIQVLADQPALIDSDFLSFTPRVEPDPEAIVVFAFGNRLSVDGELGSGRVNIELARLADSVSATNRLPVVAQWEVADEMSTPSMRIGAVEKADGSVEYLSTVGVAEEARKLLAVDRVAVLAMADHAVRCCEALQRCGFSAGLVDGVSLPTEYDSSSGQPWTRDRATYVAIDVLARCSLR